MPDPVAPTVDADAAALVKAVEAAGFVHPNAPAGFPTPGHAMAAAETPEAVDHLKEIAALAALAKVSSQSGVDTIADQIIQHVEALQAGK
jgi:hypothetical protein